MKKMALLLVVVMLVSIVAAPAFAQTKLNVAWWGNQSRNERTQSALDLYQQQNPDISIDVQMNAWGDYWEALATAAAGKELPDALQMDYSRLSQFVENNLLLDLTPYVEDGTLDISNVSEGITESGSIDGKLYAICMGVNAPALLYNKTLLDANGITVKDNMTMDEFIALCKEVYEKTGYKTDFCYGNTGMIDYLQRGLGRPMYTDGKLTLTQQDAEDFLSIYENGLEDGWMLGSAVYAETSVASVEQNPMVYGSSPDTMSWCSFFWSNQVTAVQAAAPEGVEVGITTWPSSDPAKSNYLKPSMFFSVSAQSSKEAQDASVKLLNYFLNSTDCNDILLGERGIPASSVVSSAISPKLDDLSQVVASYINDVVTPNSSAVPAPDPSFASEVASAINEMVEHVDYGAISAKDGAAALMDQLSSITQ